MSDSYAIDFQQSNSISDKNKLLNYHNLAKDARKNYRINLGLALITNFISNLYLHEGFLRKKKIKKWFRK